jgi:hypothetical protein
LAPKARSQWKPTISPSRREQICVSESSSCGGTLEWQRWRSSPSKSWIPMMPNTI